MLKLLSILTLGLMLSVKLHANSESTDPSSYQVIPVLSGLSVPWGLAFVDQDTLLITERHGALKSFNRASGIVSRIQGLPEILAEGQGGLLDISPAPNYSKTKWLYITYSKEVKGNGTTVLARAKYLSPNKLSHWEDLFIAKTDSNTSRHYGSRIAFDTSGHVFLTVGDRGQRDDAQDNRNHAGTVIRLNLDGSIPQDNPFVKMPNALPEIWSYGHRNPQGLAFSADKSTLWLIEHGPRGGDEINLVKPGENYGWPVISYGKEYWAPIAVGESTHKEGMVQPVKYYVPSIAPGSLIVYSGDAFPNWQGNLFAGALKLTHLNRVILNNQNQAVGEERLLEGLNERIRAITVSIEGWLYISTDSGKILRITPK